MGFMRFRKQLFSKLFEIRAKSVNILFFNMTTNRSVLSLENQYFILFKNAIDSTDLSAPSVY